MSSEPGRGLWDRMVTDAGRARTSLHCWVGDRYQQASWTEVLRDAERMTAGLRRIGVRPGTRVASVLTNGPLAVRGLLAVWLAGGALASLPVPARGMNGEEYLAQLAGINDQLDPVALLLDEAVLAGLPDEVRTRLRARSWESLADSGRIDADPPGPDDLAFVQYSSGSTDAPKGCTLTPRAIAAQLDIIDTMLDPRTDRDVGVSWLPLSHDMGLFGCLLSGWCNDVELYLSTPERFMFSPGSWFGDIAEYGGTIAVGSNTALYLAGRSAKRSLRGPADCLSQIRACIVGAERVTWETLSGAVDSLGPWGFRAEALMPAYGLAEATLAVTATPIEAAPTRLCLNAAALADGTLVDAADDDPAAAVMVGAGVPCAGVELVLAQPGRLSEIGIRSPSLAGGYFADDARTAQHFVDGVLHPGDLGFVHDGVLYPVGRIDDVISVAGRKVYAREIETAVDGLAGVRRGCSILVGHHEGARFRLTLFMEIQRGADYRTLAEQAASVAMAKAAVALDECVFLGRNSLPKTPSGKIQRHRCRQLLDAGRFEPLATVALTMASR